MLVGKDGEVVRNKSRVALTSEDEEGSMRVIVRELDKNEPRCALLANLMVSSGIPGNVRLILTRTDFNCQLEIIERKQ